jgi:hypothetical protein
LIVVGFVGQTITTTSALVLRSRDDGDDEGLTGATLARASSMLEDALMVGLRSRQASGERS